MQTLIQVVCSKGESLRTIITNDPALAKYEIEVERAQKPGRAPGWASLHSRAGQGALKVEWDSQANLLTCRVVNKQRGRPDALTASFVAYLLARHRRRIWSINVVPDR